MWNVSSTAPNPVSAAADPEPVDALARLRLARTPTVGPVSYRQLLLRFGDAAAALAAVPELARRGGGTAPAIPPAARIEAERAAVARAGGRYIFYATPAYPARLAAIPSAPPALVVRGSAMLWARRTVAMVGARNASAGACRFARGLAAELGERGVAVVSGLARGIDTAAHQGALDGGTIAVIAGGIDIAYPPENAELQEEIARRGLLVAEQPPGTEPRARHFPYRNRIIAGLAQAVLVVEAAPKSGSLITARHGAEFGREVLAVPGSPLDPRAQGCNLLIREGATLVQSADDVMEALSPLDGRMPLSEPPRPYGAARVPADVADRDRTTITGLLGPAPVPVDELVRQSDRSPSVVQTVLLELELAGRLGRHAGDRVSLTL